MTIDCALIGDKRNDPKSGPCRDGGYGYVGPLPPNRHLYLMTVYALSAPTGLKPRFGVDELQTAMEGKILATAELGLPFEPFQD